QDPTTLLYVSAVQARRLEGANQALIELKTQPASRAALSTKRLRRWKDCSVPAVPLLSMAGSPTGMPVPCGAIPSSTKRATRLSWRRLGICIPSPGRWDRQQGHQLQLPGLAAQIWHAPPLKRHFEAGRAVCYSLSASMVSIFSPAAIALQC